MSHERLQQVKRTSFRSGHNTQGSQLILRTLTQSRGVEPLFGGFRKDF